MSKMLELVIEKNEGHLWGRIEDRGEFMPTGQGETTKDLIQNIKDSISDYQENEGKEDKFWNKIDLDKVTFVFKYDLADFFETFSDLNISAIANRANLNPSLLRQYKIGKKHPSADQVRKIEDAIHELGKELTNAKLFFSV